MTAIIFYLHLLFSSRAGIATTFSAVDASNPNPLLYCSNKLLNDNALVVAHPKLPCGSEVFIYSPRTRRSVFARVMDRGPRHALIDLSPATASAIHSNGYESVLIVPIIKRGSNVRSHLKGAQ